MAEITLQYGSSHIAAALPDTFEYDWITPPAVSGIADALQHVSNALKHPLGTINSQKLDKNTKVAIAISDKTRPVPHPILLPPLLEWLRSFGVIPENIQFIISSGTHVPMSHDEFSLVLPPEILANYHISSHNCFDRENLIFLGNTTTNKTPVWLNSDFYHADYRIVAGSIEPHHFMGFSGGAKTAAIGLTGMETIQINHALLVHPGCITANILDNPMRMDVEEIGALIGIDLAVNAILNQQREIVQVLAGSPQEVFAAGVNISKSVSMAGIPHLYDMAIASAGGFPKDINFYQAQKAMTHAAMCLRDGGILILAAECREGAGSQGFVDFMQGTSSSSDVLSKWRNSPFRIGPHKAFLTARILERIQVILISELPAEVVKSGI